VTQEDASAALQDCTKIVSATGFDRNPLPEISIDGKPLQDLGHDRHSGAIIPGEHGSKAHRIVAVVPRPSRITTSSVAYCPYRGELSRKKVSQYPNLSQDDLL